MTAPSPRPKPVRESDLKPCPFCVDETAAFGAVTYSEKHVQEQEWPQATFHFVSCPACGVSNMGIVGFYTQAEAAEAWNKRAPARDPAQQAAPSGDLTQLATEWDKMARLLRAERQADVAEAYETCAKYLREVVSASPQKASWECMGRKQSLPEPGECNWPVCGCDPYADKVIAALQESGLARELLREPLSSQEEGSGI